MKKVLCMAALAVVFASCSDSNEDVVKVDNKATNVDAIQISQTVNGVTKAAIGSGSTVEAIVLTHDGNDTFSPFTPVYANTLNASNAFENASDRANVSVATFTAGTANSLTLSTTLYYSPVTTDNVHLLGVAPKGDIIENKAIQFTQDGKQDVMYAAKVSAGSQNLPSATPTLKFEHLTTQLKFAAKIKRVDDGTGEWKGASVRVKSISIHKVELPASLTFDDGKIVWADKLDHFSVPEIIGTPLAATATDVSKPVMMNASSGISIDVVLTIGNSDKSYMNLPVKKGNDDLVTEIKKSHLVTLEITEPTTASGVDPINAQATVAEWIAGDEGTVVIK